MSSGRKSISVCKTRIKFDQKNYFGVIGQVLLSTCNHHDRGNLLKPGEFIEPGEFTETMSSIPSISLDIVHRQAHTNMGVHCSDITLSFNTAV